MFQWVMLWGRLLSWLHLVLREKERLDPSQCCTQPVLANPQVIRWTACLRWCSWEKKTQTNLKQHFKWKEQIVKQSLIATLRGKVFLDLHIPASKYLLSFASLSQVVSVNQRTWTASEVLPEFWNPSCFHLKEMDWFLAALTCLALITITSEVKRHVYLNRGRFLSFISRDFSSQIWPSYPEKDRHSFTCVRVAGESTWVPLESVMHHIDSSARMNRLCLLKSMKFSPKRLAFLNLNYNIASKES